MVRLLRSVDLDTFSCVRPLTVSDTTPGSGGDGVTDLGLDSFDQIMPEKKMHEVIQMSRFVTSLYREHGCRCLGRSGCCQIIKIRIPILKFGMPHFSEKIPVKSS
jgi:hypothetical protein